ncbi:MAG: GspE/PulE family protein [Patescibacteria group bacterium]
MADEGFQSVNELIRASKGENMDEESVEGKFQKKHQEIKLKELERQTKQRAQKTGYPYIDLFGYPISSEAIALIAEEEAKEINAVCFYYDGNSLRIGALNPKKEEVREKLEELKEKLHVDGKIYMISKHSFDYALEIYDSLPKIERIEGGVKIKEEDLRRFRDDIKDYKSLNKKVQQVNTSDVLTLILATAIKTNSSDIHIEAEELSIAIRYRIDGVLQEAASIDKDRWRKIVSRMKLVAGVKINISNKPQDGRFSIFLDDEKIEIRASFLPTNYGESVVMRVLRSSAIALKFKELGLRKEVQSILEEEIKKPHGMILTTGPTGSGKTTTLYAILKKVNTPENKIITLENPVEYQLEGISQSQVNPKDNYSFAKALESSLRQDPDIVMVGEIRNLKTAETAVQAGLTGHLVLSTLHTNDASGVLPRMIDMGVKPYFLTPAINAIIGQRLARRLCPHCKEEHKLTKPEKDKIDKILAVISPKSNAEAPKELPTIYKAGKGCEKCNGIGYKGRVGLYELLPMDDDIKELASQDAPAFKIMQQAIENGMLTMLQDGILKALEGLTGVDEVYRVIGNTDYVDHLYDVMVSQVFGRGAHISEEEIKKAKELSADASGVGQVLKETSHKKMINIIMALALESDAGDVHIEPEEETAKIRFRIDGILHDIAEIEKEHYLPLLSGIKVLSGFPTNVKQATWDGRFSIYLKEEKMDCRISIISGGYGETVVIRILANQAASLDMKKLGMKEYTLNIVQESMSKTKGIIVNTGPTGSGKTTTLYAILNKLNSQDVKIITVEDPIEYHLEGVIQTQVSQDEGYTFAKAMRSLLRQNPNIMMIGEIRDAETAGVAIEASLTGHLVLSTIHANSAAGAISRFSGLGIEKQQLANSLNCTIGQRLVRRICPHCKQETELSDKNREEVEKVLEGMNPKIKKDRISNELKFYKSKGCDKCNNIGYKGRLGIYETIENSGELPRLVQKPDATNKEIEQEAIKNGTVTMIQDGLIKALNGDTSWDEILRVIKE